MNTGCGIIPFAVLSVVERTADMAKSSKAIVEARLKELGWSRYDLAKECEKRGIGRSPAYEWLAGTRDILSETLDVIYDVLGMAVVPDPKKRPRR